MKLEMQYHYDNTEWLYAPGFVYHQYDDGVTRELSLIFPYRAAWESDERFPLVVYIPGAAWHKQELCNDVPKYMGDKIFDIPPRERILLSAIRRRPGMYVGEYSLSRLRNFFDGYRSALREHHLDQCCCIIPGGIAFHNFVTQKYGLYPDSIRYDHAILNNIPDGKEAIETFFELLDAFLEENGFEKIDTTSHTP